MTVNNKINKSWNNESFHQTYESANSARNKLLAMWTDSEQHKGMQVKVKRLSQRYVVKTRCHPEFEVEELKPLIRKKEKKRGKNSRRNREAAAKRELDAAGTV